MKTPCPLLKYDLVFLNDIRSDYSKYGHILRHQGLVLKHTRSGDATQPKQSSLRQRDD